MKVDASLPVISKNLEDSVRFIKPFEGIDVGIVIYRLPYNENAAKHDRICKRVANCNIILWSVLYIVGPHGFGAVSEETLTDIRGPHNPQRCTTNQCKRIGNL